MKETQTEVRDAEAAEALAAMTTAANAVIRARISYAEAQLLWKHKLVTAAVDLQGQEAGRKERAAQSIGVHRNTVTRLFLVKEEDDQHIKTGADAGE